MKEIVVVKIGGSVGIDIQAICLDIANLIKQGRKIVLIHGGSHRTNQVATALGHPPQFVTSPSGYSSRLTDRATLEIFEMVYCGQINKDFVERLQKRGINAIGLSGLDGRLWEGKRKNSIRVIENGRQRVIRDNFTGRVEKVNAALLLNLLDEGYLPVLCPPAISYEGQAINVDGDRAAAATAVALEADRLLILSNIPGLLAAFPDETSLITHLDYAKIDTFSQKYAAGRMRIKMLGANEAIKGGVKRVIIGDARVSMPISKALTGEGTIIERTITT